MKKLIPLIAILFFACTSKTPKKVDKTDTVWGLAISNGWLMDTCERHIVSEWKPKKSDSSVNEWVVDTLMRIRMPADTLRDAKTHLPLRKIWSPWVSSVLIQRVVLPGAPIQRP
jgi:hypothetical protein